ncbi:MAG: caspase family protein [Flavobacteriales bacterium]|nr:caspase family protein [Flavobacteriales bacterium]
MIRFLPIALLYISTLSLFSQIQDSKVVFQNGHSDEILHIEYNEKGTIIATASEDKTINLLDAKTGLIITTLKGHTEPVLGSKFYKSKWLVSCSRDEIIVWDLNKDEEHVRVEQKFNDPKTMCFSHDGSLVFVKEKNSFLHQIDLSKPGVQEPLRVAKDIEPTNISQLYTSPLDDQIVIVGEKKVVSWNYKTNTQMAETFLQDNSFLSFIDKKNEEIHVANEYLNWIVYDLATGKFKKQRQGTSDNDRYYGRNQSIMAINGRNSVMACKGSGRNVKLYDIASGAFIKKAEELLRLEGDYKERDIDFTALAISPNGKVLVAGITIDRSSPQADTYGLRFLDIKSGKWMKDDEGYYSNIHKIRFSPNGKKLAVAGKGPLKVLHLQNAGAPILNCHENTRRTKSLYWSPDSKVIAGACSDYIGFDNYLINLPTNESKEISEHFLYQYGISMGKYLYMSPEFDLVAGANHIHNMETGEILCEYDSYKNNYRKQVGDPSGRESQKVLIPNSKTLVLLNHLDNLRQNYNLAYVDFETGTLTDMQSYTNKENRFLVYDKDYDLSVSSQGKWLCVSGATIDVIDASSHNRKHQIRNFVIDENTRNLPKRFSESCFSTDEQFVIVGGYDSLVYVINSETGTIAHKLRGHNDKVTSVSVKPGSDIVATASADNRVIFWDFIKGTKLAELVIVNDEDFMILADGNYYYSTKNAIKKAGIRKGKRVLPIEQFDLKLNRPDIILKTLEMASTRRIDVFEKAYYKRLAKAGITEDQLDNLYSGPNLQIVGKYDLPSTTQNKLLTLTLNVTDNHPLKSYQVYINGVPIVPDEDSFFKQSVSELNQQIEIPLSAGKNKVEVGVTNEKGVESIREHFEINLQEDYEPKLYIVSVGVSKYQNNQYDLKYASKDAVDIVKAFKNSEAFSSVVDQSITDEKATKQAIEASIANLKETNINDMVLIYFAGHGLLNSEYDYFLATHNTDFNDPTKTALGYSELERLVAQIPARNRLILMDACHSGELDKEYQKEVSEEKELLAQNEVNTRGIGANVQPKIGLFNSFAYMQALFNDVSTHTGATVIAAAGGVEFAYESKEIQNGLFTYAIKNALNNKAGDANSDGVLKVSELQNYVRNQVYSLSQGKQIPTTREVNKVLDFKVY